MSSPIHVLGVDIGTGGVRTLLVEATTGAVLAREQEAWPSSSLHPGWSEQDPDTWWKSTSDAIRRLVDGLDDPGAIKAVAFAGQMHGLVLHDENGNVLRPAILWNDQRTVSQCEEVHDRVGRDTCISITGKPVLTGFTSPKLLWVQEHEPEVASRIAHICLPKDHILFKATGTRTMDVTDASGTSWLDLSSRNWSESICSSLGVNPSWLPPVRESSEVIGAINAQGAAATGLPEGIPVVAGAGDQAAAGLACGVTREGLVSMTIGTSGVVFAQSDTPPSDPTGILHGFCHAVQDRWHVMGCMLSAGGCLEWWRNVIGRHDGAVGFDELVKEASNLSPGAEGLCFLPYLNGERTPHNDPRARGAFIGLASRHDQRHMTRAVLEGISFGLADMLDLLRGAGHAVDSIRVAGGAARSETWLQLLADVFQATVETVNEPDATAYGAAMLASIGAGAVADAQAAADTLVHVTGTYEPGGSCFKQARSTWQTLYPELAAAMHRLADQSMTC